MRVNQDRGLRLFRARIPAIFASEGPDARATRGGPGIPEGHVFRGMASSASPRAATGMLEGNRSMRFHSVRAAVTAGVFLLCATAAPVLAMGDWPPEPTTPGGGGVTHVPEIDAGAGIAALAAVGAALAFAWERRRR